MYQIPICDKKVWIYGECPCSTPPTFSGVTVITVHAGEEFDPTQGVTAKNCQNRQVRVTAEEGE